MLLNIKTGYGGIKQRSNEEIVILVSSLYKIRDYPLQFLFTDKHAYVPTAVFYDDLRDLSLIDWEILRRSDFKRNINDLGKLERYQAEALIHQHVPIDALLGIVCASEFAVARVQPHVVHAGAALKALAKPEWYFQ